MNERMANKLKEVGGKDVLNDFLAEMSVGEFDDEMFSIFGRTTSRMNTARS